MSAPAAWQAVAERGPPAWRWTAGRIVLVVLGCFTGLAGLALVGYGVLLFVELPVLGIALALVFVPLGLAVMLGGSLIGFGPWIAHAWRKRRARRQL